MRSLHLHRPPGRVGHDAVWSWVGLRRALLGLRTALRRGLSPRSLVTTLWALQSACDVGRALLSETVAPAPRPIVVRGGRLLSAAEIRGPRLNPGSAPSRFAWGRTLPLLDARVVGAPGRSGRFAVSPIEHDGAILVGEGSEVVVALYVATTSTRVPPAPEVRRVLASVSDEPPGARAAPGDPSPFHELVAVVSGDEVQAASSAFAEWGGDVALRSSRPTRLAYVAASAALCRIADPAARDTTAPDPREACRAGAASSVRPPLADSGRGLPSWDLGDLPPGYHGVLVFRLRVVATPGAAAARRPTSDACAACGATAPRRRSVGPCVAC
jgi:hypothetical protein